MSDVNKLKYGVYVLKRSEDHIAVLETDKYDDAYNLWVELKDRWAVSIKEQKPFELTAPIVTAFDPGLVYEITVRPVPQVAPELNTNNPYAKKMQQEGFGAMFNNQGPILDAGYRL